MLIGENKENLCSPKCYSRALIRKDSEGHYYDSVSYTDADGNTTAYDPEGNMSESQDLAGQPPEKSLGHYDSGQPPEKFGGFLLFLAYVLPIGFILAPLSTLLSLGQLTGMTYRANAEIKEAVRTFSGLTMIFQLCLTLVFVYLLYLFYKKKRNFPILYKWTIALNILTTFIFPWRYFGVLAKFSPYSRSELYWETFREPKVLIMLLSLTSIFIYFHFSTRVKKTFTQ